MNLHVEPAKIGDDFERRREKFGLVCPLSRLRRAEMPRRLGLERKFADENLQPTERDRVIAEATLREIERIEPGEVGLEESPVLKD